MYVCYNEINDTKVSSDKMGVLLFSSCVKGLIKQPAILQVLTAVLPKNQDLNFQNLV
jgi:hypothetical protein